MVALLTTCPPSPLFIGLEQPIPVTVFRTSTSLHPDLVELLVAQCSLLNAATIAAIVMFPINAAHTTLKVLSATADS